MRIPLSPRWTRPPQPTSTPGQGTNARELWLRRGTPSRPDAPGTFTSIRLVELGVAAARETFLTATVPFAAAWTNLFREMLADSHRLQWLGNGPGVGRDARIAYSGLLGRYMARAYLTAYEGICDLIPLDEAKRRLEGTPFSIRKERPGRGHEADWIGHDNRGRVVIAEAKGSFDPGVRAWSGPVYRPAVLQTAIEQAGRTAVFVDWQGTPLRVTRWAIASRWANQCNERIPTLLAWDPDEEELGPDEYRQLAYHLRRADVDGVMNGLGHHEAARVLMTGGHAGTTSRSATPSRRVAAARPRLCGAGRTCRHSPIAERT